MGNSTFSGAVRSENGFKSITRNTTTGADTDGFVVNSAGNIFNTAGGHVQYAAATGYGPADLIVGKGGSQYGTVNPYAESSTQLFPLSAQLHYGNNIYRYGQMGSGAVTAGKLVQHAAVIANHTNMTGTAGVAAGETAISVETSGDTDMTLNQYADGYLWVNDAAGEGPLATAITTSSELSLIANPYTGLIVAPATETGTVMGATVIDMTASYYGWFTVSGPQALLSVGTLVVGNIAVRSGGTAGGVAPATDNVLTEIGEVMAARADTEYSLVYMNLQ